VEVRLELRALIGDDAPRRQAEHLVAAAVGQDRPVPSDKPVKAAASCDQIVAGTKKKVIGVAENDLGTGRADVLVQRRFDCALRTNGHERGRLNAAVGRVALAKSGRAIARTQGESERAAQARLLLDERATSSCWCDLRRTLG